MKRRLIAPLFVAAALLALGSIAAACGGDDKLTLEEYFEQFQVIDADVDAKFETLYEDFPDEGEEELFSNEENLPLFKEIFAGFPVILTDALDALEELNPPSETEDAHDEFLATGREWLEVLEDGADRVEAVESILEIEQIEEELEPAQGEAQERFDAACLDLVGVGQANGIVVDVSCEE
jgi:hypothetical protein